jgi:hypothetical protein
MTVTIAPGKNQRRPRTRLERGLIVVALLAGLAGCFKSDSLPVFQVYEVKGKVLLANGKPLTAGWVYLVPKGDLSVTPSGEIASDGSFAITTGGSGAGAPPGEYKIRVEAPQFGPSKKGEQPVVPIKYTDEDSSGLVVTVRASSNQLEPFVLK